MRLDVRKARARSREPVTTRGEGPVPDVRRPCTAHFSVTGADGERCEIRHRWKPGRHWQVCFVPVAHHDYGYTRTIETVLGQYEDYYEDVLRYCDATTDYPEEARFRYQAETGVVAGVCAEGLFAGRPRARLIERMRDGSIEVPALLGNQISNLCGHERTGAPALPFVRDEAAGTACPS